MRGLVQPRPFVKGSHKGSTSSRTGISFYRGKRRGKDQQSAFSSALKKRGALFFISIIALFLGIFLLKGTWYNPTYLIQNIEYPEETKKEYGNTELFVLASKFLRGKYYNTLRVGGEGKLLERVRKEYPFVKETHITFLGNQTVNVLFDYYEPSFLVKLGEKKFGVRGNNQTAELDDSWELGKGVFIVDTPGYLTGTTSLSGFFYEVKFEWYKEYIPIIQKTFPNMERFVYLAGSPNFVLFENGKMIFLYKDDVAHQLQKYERLKKYYSAFDTLAIIDLGSLIQEKVVVGWG